LSYNITSIKFEKCFNQPVSKIRQDWPHINLELDPNYMYTGIIPLPENFKIFNTNCPVCDTTKCDIALHCGHAYCSECLDRWLMRDNVCCLCRFKVSCKYTLSSYDGEEQS